MAEDEFVFDWMEKLGFAKNPCHLEVPKKVQNFYVGYKEERKKLNLFILENHPFGTIRGDEGYGKTMTLNWVISHLNKHKKNFRVAHFNAADLRKERDLIETLAKPMLNPFEKLIKKTHKKLSLEELGRFIYSKLKSGTHYLILIDDAGKLPKKYISLFKYFFKNNLKVQLIVAGEKGDLGAFKNVEEDHLEIELGGLKEEEMVDMMRKRISAYGRSGLFPYNESMLKDLYEESNGSPKEFLKLARKKAVKLSLDKEYIQKRLEETEGKTKKVGFGLISINIEEKEEEPEEDFLDFEAPDPEEQEELLKAAEQENFQEAEDEVLEKAMKEKPDEEEKERKDSKSEAEKTEELLEELAREFE